jgi:hypothetical protein
MVNNLATREKSIRTIRKLSREDFQRYVDEHPFFSVHYDLDGISKSNLPKDFKNWAVTGETMLDWTGISAIMDYSFTKGQKIIPGFLFNFGYASWENAVDGSGSVFPSIEFDYVMYSPKNRGERAFLRQTMNVLEKEVFGHLEKAGNQLQDHREMMENNYWLRFYLRNPAKEFIQYGLEGRTQNDAFDALFEEVDGELRNRISAKKEIPKSY